MKPRILPVILICLGIVASSQLKAQSADPLASFLHDRYLTVVPDGLSTYKPGALIELASQSIPSPVGPTSDVEKMTLDLQTAYIPTVDITGASDISVATTITGFSFGTKFNKSDGLHADALTLAGWGLSPEDLAAIQANDSPTFLKAKALWTRARLTAGNLLANRRTTLYLITAVFTTTSANISTTDQTGLALSGGGTLPSCSAAAPAASPTTGTGASAHTDNATGTVATPANAAAPTGGVATPATNPVAADITAAGGAAAAVLAAARGQSAAAGVATSAKMTVQNLIPITMPTASFCMDTTKSIKFTSQVPVPIAMTLQQISFNTGYTGDMQLTPQAPTWPMPH
jgi:hypothetical protein